MSQVTPKQQSRFVQNLTALRDCIFYNFLGGPKVLPLRYVINIFKGLTWFWVVFLMFYFRNFSTGMFVYLFIHGTYGFAWIYKDVYFGDATFKTKATFGSNIVCGLFLCLYWTIPIPLAIGNGVNHPPLIRIIFIISMYFFGVYLMLGSDYQKTKTLEKRKGLISDGFFRNTRNPNYLGEMLIYFSFAACSGSLHSYLVFFGGSCFLFSINMYLKDKLSYEKKQGWDQYKKDSYIVFPKIMPSLVLNIALYGVLSIFIGYFCAMGNQQQDLLQSLLK